MTYLNIDDFPKKDPTPSELSVAKVYESKFFDVFPVTASRGSGDLIVGHLINPEMYDPGIEKSPELKRLYNPTIVEVYTPERPPENPPPGYSGRTLPLDSRGMALEIMEKIVQVYNLAEQPFSENVSKNFIVHNADLERVVCVDIRNVDFPIEDLHGIIDRMRREGTLVCDVHVVYETHHGRPGLEPVPDIKVFEHHYSREVEAAIIENFKTIPQDEHNDKYILKCVPDNLVVKDVPVREQPLPGSSPEDALPTVRRVCFDDGSDQHAVETDEAFELLIERATDTEVNIPQKPKSNVLEASSELTSANRAQTAAFLDMESHPDHFLTTNVQADNSVQPSNDLSTDLPQPDLGPADIYSENVRSSSSPKVETPVATADFLPVPGQAESIETFDASEIGINPVVESATVVEPVVSQEPSTAFTRDEPSIPNVETTSTAKESEIANSFETDSVPTSEPIGSQPAPESKTPFVAQDQNVVDPIVEPIFAPAPNTPSVGGQNEEPTVISEPVVQKSFEPEVSVPADVELNTEANIDHAVAEHNLQSELQSVPEPEPIVQPRPEPVAVPEPQPNVATQPAPVPVPEPVPTPININPPTYVPEPVPTKVDLPQPVFVPEPVPNAVNSAEPIPVPEPIPTPISQPEPIPVPEPIPTPIVQPEPVPIPEPEPIVQPTPEPVVVPEQIPQPVISM